LCGGYSTYPHVYLPPRVGGGSRCDPDNPTIDDVITNGMVYTCKNIIGGVMMVTIVVVGW
jgi:hypothetical protein